MEKINIQGLDRFRTGIYLTDEEISRVKRRNGMVDPDYGYNMHQLGMSKGLPDTKGRYGYSLNPANWEILSPEEIDNKILEKLKQK